MDKRRPKDARHSEGAHHAPSAHRAKKDANTQKITIALALVFIGMASYGTYLAYSSNAIVSGKIAASVEAATPANIEMTKILAQGCLDCFDISIVDSALAQLNVKTSEKVLDYSSDEAKQLISRYKIAKVPTVLLTGEVEKAGIDFWSQVGTIESDGTLVLRFGAPYIDPASGTEFGRVQLIELADKTCSSCYNISIQENILKNGFGISLSKITGYDVSSPDGARLVSQYNITKVPTIILSPDVKYYESIKEIWKQVGTIESDGYYVFRDMKALSGVTYRDLSLNKTISAAAQ
jgi:hypothetical protein